MAITELKKNRLIFVYFVILSIFVAIILRLFFLSAFGDKLKINFIYNLNKINKRGDIVDRNNVLVATDLKTKSLYISNALVKDAAIIAKGLATIFPDLTYKEIISKISDRKSNKAHKGWVLIRRNVTPAQEERVQNLKIAGLLFEDDRVRVYPQRSILSHLVGYVDLDRQGLAGIEMQYDRQLMREDKKLQLAADVRVQDILNNELINGIEEFKAQGASGIVMDVTNGEILALSSLPSFDPNLQQDASPDQRFNRVTNGVYELGSIFKIFTNAIAFEKNLVKMEDVFNVSDPIKYGRFTIKDDHPFKGEMTVAEIFSHSSNIGTVQIAQKIGIDNQKDFLNDIGFMKRLEVDFPGLGRPIYPRLWRDINLYTISYGHGIAVTPLHVAMATAAIVNGGMYYNPSFLKLENKSGEQPSGRRVLKETTSATMRQMMRTVVTDGTGRYANIEGYEVGGKTGTANKVEGNGYNERQTIASFIAVFPISQPKYLVYIVLDHPNYTFNTGGMVSAPIAGRVVKNIAPILDVLPKL